MSAPTMARQPRKQRMPKATAATIEDVEFLVSVGEQRAEVVARTGYNNWASLERLLLRNGRHDLVSKLPAAECLFLTGRFRAVTR